ncbi:extracellular calcium-sensing receptor-like [Lissotriton helveticus]
MIVVESSEETSGVVMEMSGAEVKMSQTSISYGSELPMLSDKSQFPSFLRTVPSNIFQITAMVRLIGHFNWTWIGMIISDDETGLQGGQDLKAAIEHNKGCVAYMEKTHATYNRTIILTVAKYIQRHTAKVIIVYSSVVHVKNLLEALSAQNVTDKTFIFSTSFTMTLGLFSKQAWRLFNGSLGLVLRITKMPGFEEFLTRLNPMRDPNDRFIKLFWEKAFNCRWLASNGSGTLTPVTQGGTVTSCFEKQTIEKIHLSEFELNDLSSSYHTYLAVFALAHAVTSLMVCTPGQGPFGNGACADNSNIKPWQVLHYVKRMNLSLKIGAQISFDENGDAPSAYDIVNVQIFNYEEIQLVNVGNFDSQQDTHININNSAILWGENTQLTSSLVHSTHTVTLSFLQLPRSVCSEECPPGCRQAAIKGKPICCFECIPCAQEEIRDPDTDECMKCPDDQWPSSKHDQCIPKVIEFLSFDEPLGYTLSFAAAFLALTAACVLGIFLKYGSTPIVKANNRRLSYLLLIFLKLCFLCSFIFIGRPTKLSCMLRQTIFGIIFSISVSMVLAKTILTVIAFKAKLPNSPARKLLGGKTPSCIVSLCSLIQVVICALWLAKSPPFPEPDLLSYNEKIIVECNEGKHFFYWMLGYMGLLATVSFIVAFVSRDLPGSFNEAKLITFSMVVFVSVWISFIPAYLSTQGKYMVAVEVFAILCSSAGLLGCIFFPKCYIILFRPDMNSRHNIIGRKNVGTIRKHQEHKRRRS